MPKYPNQSQAIACGRVLVGGLQGEASQTIANFLANIGAYNKGRFPTSDARELVAWFKANPRANTGDLPAKFQVDGFKYQDEANYVIYHVLGTKRTQPDPGGTKGLGLTDAASGAVHAAEGIVHDFTSWEKALQAVLTALASGQFWIRAGEVVIGGSLVLIGIDSMLKLGLVQKGSEAAKVAAFA